MHATRFMLHVCNVNAYSRAIHEYISLWLLLSFPGVPCIVLGVQNESGGNGGESDASTHVHAMQNNVLKCKCRIMFWYGGGSGGESDT